LIRQLYPIRYLKHDRTEKYAATKNYDIDWGKPWLLSWANNSSCCCQYSSDLIFLGSTYSFDDSLQRILFGILYPMTETDFLYVHRFWGLKNNIYISVPYLFSFGYYSIFHLLSLFHYQNVVIPSYQLYQDLYFYQDVKWTIYSKQINYHFFPYC